MRCPAAVKALSMAVLMEVIFAPSMRAKARRWHDASTMAMFIGTPISSARFSAAARARRAPVRVRVGVVFVDMFDVLVNVQEGGSGLVGRGGGEIGVVGCCGGFESFQCARLG